MSEEYGSSETNAETGPWSGLNGAKTPGGLDMRRSVYRDVFSLLVMTALLTCSACKTPSAGITVESYPGRKITVNSLIVGDRLTISEYNVQRTDLGYLRAQIKARNTTNNNYRFEYKYVWYDADGFEIRTALSSWVPVWSSAQSEAIMGAVAPSKQAEAFTFQVRPPKGRARW